MSAELVPVDPALELADQRLSLFDAIQLAIGKADEQVALMSVDELGVGIRQLAELAAALRVLADSAKAEARRKMDAAGLRRVETPAGVLIPDSGLTRTGWQHDELLVEVVKRAWDAGEIHHHTDVASLLRSTVQFSGWKIGQLDRVTGEWSGLRRLGIDAADYCTEARKRSVRFQ